MLATLLLALPLPAPAPVTPTPKQVRAAVEAALPPLQKGAAGHAEQRTCFACHNQALPMLAFNAAKGRGFTVPPELLKGQADHVAAFLDTNRDRFKDGRGTGGQVDSAGYAMLTLELAGHAPDANTAAVAEFLLKTQADRDHWRSSGNRPPSEASDFSATYLALRALNFWGSAANLDKAKVAKRVESARAWLLKTPAKDVEDRVFRLLALKEADASAKDLSAAAWELQKTQRADGGWAQRDGGRSDAYATGAALVALHLGGGLRTDAPAYRTGLGYLVGTQRADGTWLVRSRSKPFQPYYETGFPHAKDQFIAITASGWATAALAYATEKKGN